MNRLHRIAASMALLAIGISAISTAATAQSTNTLAQSGMRDSRFQAGIVIPFGSAGSEAERAPRLEAWSDHGQQRERTELRLRDGRDPAAAPVRIGITLTERPRMMLNGRELPQQDDQKNVSTLGWVAIGLGVAVVVFGALVFDAARDANN